MSKRVKPAPVAAIWDKREGPVLLTEPEAKLAAVAALSDIIVYLQSERPYDSWPFLKGVGTTLHVLLSMNNQMYHGIADGRDWHEANIEIEENKRLQQALQRWLLWPETFDPLTYCPLSDR